MAQSKKKAPKAVRVVISLAILIGYIWCFTQTDNLIGEKFLIAGFGLIVGLLFYFILTSLFSGIPKNELKVPIKPVVLIIIVGVAHMLIGGYLGIET